MASGNRVEQLESRVRELEASVDGLTDELMECKRRLEAIEEEVGPEMDIIEGKTTVSSDGGTDTEETADTSNTDDTGDDDSDEIIVA